MMERMKKWVVEDTMEKRRMKANEPERSLEWNRFRQIAGVLEYPMPLTANRPIALRVTDAIDDLDRSDDCPCG